MLDIFSLRLKVKLHQFEDHNLNLVLFELCYIQEYRIQENTK